jgi:hypothetical protein
MVSGHSLWTFDPRSPRVASCLLAHYLVTATTNENYHLSPDSTVPTTSFRAVMTSSLSLSKMSHEQGNAYTSVLFLLGPPVVFPTHAHTSLEFTPRPPPGRIFGHAQMLFIYLTHPSSSSFTLESSPLPLVHLLVVSSTRSRPLMVPPISLGHSSRRTSCLSVQSNVRLPAGARALARSLVA